MLCIYFIVTFVLGIAAFVSDHPTPLSVWTTVEFEHGLADNIRSQCCKSLCCVLYASTSSRVSITHNRFSYLLDVFFYILFPTESLLFRFYLVIKTDLYRQMDHLHCLVMTAQLLKKPNLHILSQRCPPGFFVCGHIIVINLVQGVREFGTSRHEIVAFTQKDNPCLVFLGLCRTRNCPSDHSDPHEILWNVGTRA